MYEWFSIGCGVVCNVHDDDDAVKLTFVGLLRRGRCCHLENDVFRVHNLKRLAFRPRGHGRRPGGRRRRWGRCCLDEALFLTRSQGHETCQQCALDVLRAAVCDVFLHFCDFQGRRNGVREWRKPSEHIIVTKAMDGDAPHRHGHQHTHSRSHRSARGRSWHFACRPALPAASRTPA
jgi:hypothetical protein